MVPDSGMTFENAPPLINLSECLQAQMGSLEILWCVIPQLRLVGGVVRDILAGEEVHDIDLAAPFSPQRVQALLEAQNIKVVLTGLKHGTVTAVMDKGQSFEITTLRQDIKTDGRHAEVIWTEDWQEDAKRRDFTINAMSCNREGRVYDYFHGFEDLKNRKVRFVGCAARRIQEDALRILRFFRFQARFGAGHPDSQALEAIAGTLPLLAQLSVERIWSELGRILSGPNRYEILVWMMRTGVLPYLLEGQQHVSSEQDLQKKYPINQIGILDNLFQQIEVTKPSYHTFFYGYENTPRDPLLALSILVQNKEIHNKERERFTRSLHLSGAEEKKLAFLQQDQFGIFIKGLGGRLVHVIPPLSSYSIAQLLSEVEHGPLFLFSWKVQSSLFLLRDDKAHLRALEKEGILSPELLEVIFSGQCDYYNFLWEKLRIQIGETLRPQFPLRGRDLMAIGLQAGRNIGFYLARIRAWWLAHGCQPGKNDCLEELRKWL
ncbi:CCA tRNA nucleotidyltransferase [Entomobacter blattae]|uniref:CCA-adding enzyme n=1 Tax=Entomobacter blattae TaxID=2762277 RepID=A0A7H1NNC4_9PROT|nr:CCA tRNA nucleotidyltransferase [Entomobacter blattae]QNT77284.1 CCA-adding enzyme [Entomobacter blattae]